MGCHLLRLPLWCHRPCGLCTEGFSVLEATRPHQGAAGLASGEGPPRAADGHLLTVPSHGCSWARKETCDVSSYEDARLTRPGPHSHDPTSPCSLPEDPSPNAATLGLGLQHVNVGAQFSPSKTARDPQPSTLGASLCEGENQEVSQGKDLGQWDQVTRTWR